MMDNDFVVSGDGHVLEPTDLFVTRLPKHLRDRAVWEEDFEIEPWVEDGATKFRRLHTRASRAGPCHAIARPADGCPRATRR